MNSLPFVRRFTKNPSGNLKAEEDVLAEADGFHMSDFWDEIDQAASHSLNYKIKRNHHIVQLQ